MNWKVTGLALSAIGAAVALIGWAWAHSIHGQRQRCRIANIFGPEATCPSKAPAIIMAGVGGVMIVLGVALLLGAVAATPRQRTLPSNAASAANDLDPPHL